MRFIAGLLCLCLSFGLSAARADRIVSARQYEIFKPASQPGPLPAVMLLRVANWGSGSPLPHLEGRQR
jgi:hypothetical protein